MYAENTYVQEWFRTVHYSSANHVSKKDVNRFLVFLAYTYPCIKLTTTEMELIDIKGELHQILTNKIEDLKIDFNNYYKFDKVDESIIRIKLPKTVKNMLFTTYGVKAVMRKAIVLWVNH